MLRNRAARTQARPKTQRSPEQRAPAAPAGAGGFPLNQLPPHLLLLGAFAFLSYTALYIVDIILLKLTFVPGNAAPWLLVLRIAVRQKATLKDVAKLSLAVTQVPWRVLVGSQYRPGSGIVIRAADSLIGWSYRLEVAALCAAALLVCRMRWHDRPRVRGQGWLQVGSVLQVIPTQPWSVLAVVTAAVIFWAPPMVRSAYKGAVPASFMVVVWSLLQRRLCDEKSLVARIPKICYWQMGLSLYRLRSLDPYAHQVHTWAALLQLLFLIKMLRMKIVKPGMKYCYSWIVSSSPTALLKLPFRFGTRWR